MVDCEADESGNRPCCCFEDDDVTELLEWVDASNGQIPRGAVKVAFPDWYDKKEEMYLARAEHDGGIYPGTFLATEGVVDIPVRGKVISKSEYQVCHLVLYIIILKEFLTIIRWR